MSGSPALPNILLVLADNLGWGELGCYGGGALRGAPTPRIDKLADEGLRFLNFNVESDCVPTRSALMTGRHPIRTGALQAIPAGLPQGIVPWEATIAQLLSDRGYATAIFGKWHLGDRIGRYPTDRGFDSWYGIPGTSNESMFAGSPGYDPAVVAAPHVMEGRRGEPAWKVEPFDLAMRRRIDAELVRRAMRFMRDTAASSQPFFAYVALTQVHYPTLAHEDFVGSTGAGEFADSLAEMDHRVGELLDELDVLGIAGRTVVLFGSDNGPEFRRPWRGTAGPWRGTYHTSMEGGLRVPFMLRWPGHVAPGRVKNDVVHVTDLYPTLARIAGAALPLDRPIDGIDQLDFFTGQSAHSSREGFVFFIKDDLRAVKWRDWKLHIVWEPEPNSGPIRLETPYLFNLLQDPKEETDLNATGAGWARAPLQQMILDIKRSLKEHPAIPPGAPDGYVPASRPRKGDHS